MSDFNEFPSPPKLKKLLGPSFIILALGLGSGEIILWPYLVSNYGLGIAWGALLGITFQFFINMEIERYALVKGESVFVGIAKIFRLSTYWFIFSTFLGFGLPGIIAASAKVFGALFGITNFKWLAMVLLTIIGLILSGGKTAYDVMEKITKTVLIVGVPVIFLFAITLGAGSDWLSLFRGVAGKGDNFWFIPSGISLAAFLAAFAYSGAGGNLNLTQSIYIKEKGYGMGKYSPKMAGLFRGGKKQEIKLEGESFELNESNLSNFKKWWRLINIEHLMVFWFIGSISMLLLMLLAYSTAYGLQNNSQGIEFVINESVIIGQRLFPAAAKIFLLIIGVMLFQTQLGVTDSTSRIMAENTAIIKRSGKKGNKLNLSAIYLFFVWAQIAFGTLLFLFNIYEPRTLIVVGAVINAFAMFVHIGLVSALNNKSLPQVLRPSLWRKIIIAGIFLFFGAFSLYTIF